MEKQEGPTTRLRFQGINSNTTTGQLLLPVAKLTELRQIDQERVGKENSNCW